MEPDNLLRPGGTEVGLRDSYAVPKTFGCDCAEQRGRSAMASLKSVGI
jgi:hypothetical protein